MGFGWELLSQFEMGALLAILVSLFGFCGAMALALLCLAFCESVASAVMGAGDFVFGYLRICGFNRNGSRQFGLGWVESVALAVMGAGDLGGSLWLRPLWGAGDSI